MLYCLLCIVALRNEIQCFLILTLTRTETSALVVGCRQTVGVLPSSNLVLRDAQQSPSPLSQASYTGRLNFGNANDHGIACSFCHGFAMHKAMQKDVAVFLTVSVLSELVKR